MLVLNPTPLGGLVVAGETTYGGRHFHLVADRPNSTQNTGMSLNEKLEEMRTASWGRWAPEKVTILHRSFEELIRSGILDRALKKGDRAPDFSLIAANGETVSLSSLLRHGPVVLAFYRGHW